VRFSEISFGRWFVDQVPGEIASTMDKLTKRALQAQVEAAVRLLLAGKIAQ